MAYKILIGRLFTRLQRHSPFGLIYLLKRLLVEADIVQHRLVPFLSQKIVLRSFIDELPMISDVQRRRTAKFLVVDSAEKTAFAAHFRSSRTDGRMLDVH